MGSGTPFTETLQQEEVKAVIYAVWLELERGCHLAVFVHLKDFYLSLPKDS